MASPLRSGAAAVSGRMSKFASGKLFVLIITNFVDMVGVLMIIPLMPFYAREMGGGALVVVILMGAFTAAQLLSAPFWGRFSDRYGRRPALLVGLTASCAAYIVFAYAGSIWLLLLSRIVQGAGGGTVGVIQAYVADSVEPDSRAKALGWLSAATNVGVAIGPAIGGMALRFGRSGPGLAAATLCLVNIFFAWKFLRESRDMTEAHVAKPRTSRAVIAYVITHPGEPAPRLIWIYAIAMGAFSGLMGILALFLADRFGVSKDNIWVFYTYVGVISVVTRAGILGKMVDRYGEAQLSRVGLALLATGLATLPLARGYGMLAITVALIPLGTAFTFPCVTSMLSRVISSRERGLYMGVQQTFGGLSRVVIPLWAGFSYDHFGKTVPLFTSAALVLGTIILGFGIDDGRKAPVPVTSP
ncbi:MAG TPA: MFS transporter [Gemmatimonadaceae bacterium]|jgi:MFS family permease|nr:MFS transporter [Gemmatimonadaceae bacterium]